jgi:hypothetical protein
MWNYGPFLVESGGKIPPGERGETGGNGGNRGNKAIIQPLISWVEAGELEG